MYVATHVCMYKDVPHPMQTFSSPSYRVVENNFPSAELEVIDEHQAFLRVAVDSVTRAKTLHGETWWRFSQKLFYLCHCDPAVRRAVYRHG